MRNNKSLKIPSYNIPYSKKVDVFDTFPNPYKKVAHMNYPHSSIWLEGERQPKYILNVDRLDQSDSLRKEVHLNYWRPRLFNALILPSHIIRSKFSESVLNAIPIPHCHQGDKVMERVIEGLDDYLSKIIFSR